MSEAAETFGPYTLLGRLGAGGMAVTYRARERIEGVGDRVVALKQILPSYARDVAFRRMFLDEARLSTQLSHQNICRTYTAGEIDEALFISMEYIEGVDLWELMKRGSHIEGGFPLPHALYIVEQVALGLHAAHTASSADGVPLGLVHRDVSPQNVRISWRGEVKVIDFGVAKAATNHAKTKAGTVKGKVLYLSPEQLDAKPLDGRSDLFALGLILYELLTGIHPLKADTEVATVFNYYNRVIERPDTLRPDLPRSVADLAVTALDKDRDARFGDAREMARAVGDALFEVYPSYKPYLLEDFVAWARDGEIELDYRLPESKAAVSTDARVAPTTRAPVALRPPARSTVVEAHLPEDVQAKAAALIGAQPLTPRSPAHSNPVQARRPAVRAAAIAPLPQPEILPEARRVVTLWPSIAVGMAILAVAGVWVVVLMVVSSL